MGRPPSRAFARHPALAEVSHDLIGPDARLYWDQAVYKKPEPHREFPWHQDNGYTFVEPQQYLTCWVPLTDATIENGCPWAMPRMAPKWWMRRPVRTYARTTLRGSSSCTKEILRTLSS